MEKQLLSNFFLLDTVLLVTSTITINIGSLTRGVRLNQGIFQTVEPLLFIGCFKECLLQRKCNAFTFNSVYLRCQLGESMHDAVSSTDLSYLTVDPHLWINTEQMSESCANHTCIPGTKCISIGKTAKCVVTECNPPNSIAFTNEKPTDNSVGSSFAYSCQSGYSINDGSPDVTCKANGQWTPKNFYCMSIFCDTSAGFTDGVVCYKRFSIFKNPGGAKYECKKIGARLARIDTQAKFDYMQSQTTGYYVDGSDAHEEGVWRYSDGSLVNYYNWGSGYGSVGSCLFLSFNGFQDVDCIHWYNFLCEIP